MTKFDKILKCSRGKICITFYIVVKNILAKSSSNKKKQYEVQDICEKSQTKLFSVLVLWAVVVSAMYKGFIHSMGRRVYKESIYRQGWTEREKCKSWDYWWRQHNQKRGL